MQESKGSNFELQKARQNQAMIDSLIGAKVYFRGLGPKISFAKFR